MNIKEFILRENLTQTPYIGGNTVYSARVMLGIDADDYGLNYKETTFELIDNNSFVLFPNPAKDEVTIVFSDGNTEECNLELFDITGKLIVSKILNANNNFTLNTSDFNNGVYVCKIIVNDCSKGNEKLIIVK